MKLLVVDDSPEITELLSVAMELFGHRVDEAADGVMAIERLKNGAYDVVITDAEMPRMGGAEVCKFLKKNFPDVYVIGISGCQKALGMLKNAGADSCFAKPFNISELAETVENRCRPSQSGPMKIKRLHRVLDVMLHRPETAEAC
jgi:two-component system, OmpR family, response regulator MprA